MLFNLLTFSLKGKIVAPQGSPSKSTRNQPEPSLLEMTAIFFSNLFFQEELHQKTIEINRKNRCDFLSFYCFIKYYCTLINK